MEAASQTSSTSISGRSSTWPTRPSASVWSSFLPGTSHASRPHELGGFAVSSRGAPTKRRLIAEAGAPRLDRFIAEHASDLSRAAAARLIKSHLVLVNGKPADPSDRVSPGDVVELEIPEAYTPSATGEAIPLDVVYEDDDLVIVNKPAGMVVHPAPGHHGGT